MTFAPGIALLAPVPEDYLKESVALCASEGKVAFGSRAWEVFRELEKLRSGLPVRVLLYASHAETATRATVTWRGSYVGRLEVKNGRHPGGLQYRPPSSAHYPEDNAGHWALFWEVAGVELLPTAAHVKTRDLRGLGKSKYYPDGFVPEGPMLVEWEEPSP